MATDASNISITPFGDEVIGSFRVFIMDIDGTLMNGSETIVGVADQMFQLLSDESKKVLFYSNGGYCTLEHTWSKVV